MTKEMKVGDIGVLQNLCKPEFIYLSETPAEVVDVFYKGGVMKYWSKNLAFEDGYSVVTVVGNVLGIARHMIRPISDPDAEQAIDEQETIEA